MIDSNKFPLCESLIERLKQKFNQNGWVTLADEHIFSCLIPDDMIEKSMSTDAWEINHCATSPVINEDIDGSFISYSDQKEYGIEPIVKYLENEGRWNEQVFLTEEFVMFYKLHKEKKGDNEYHYYQVDECGEDVLVAKVKNLNLEVRLKYIKEFIAIKQLNLLIYIDEVINSFNSIEELGGNQIPFSLNFDETYLFSYALSNSLGLGMDYKSCAIFRGKCIYRYNKENIQHLWKLQDKGFEEFIVGANENGEELLMSCEEKRIPNLFTRKGEEPYSLSPVYFKRDVLSKYHSSVEKYSIHDGYLLGPTWGIYIDNDRSDDYIVVPLIDLGRLPHKEQIHWKNYNVLPPNGLYYSETAYKRWFEALPTDPSEAPDLVFKKLYGKINDVWNQKYGWKLFKELAKDDQYHFDALHLMGQDNDQKEFDALIQSLTKIVIDSLNEKNLVDAIKCDNESVINHLTENKIPDNNPKNIKGGIAKFECFLISEGKLNSEFITLLKKIQELRSSTVAHRKTTNPDKKSKELYDYFGIMQKKDNEVFFNILCKLNEMLAWLIIISK